VRLQFSLAAERDLADVVRYLVERRSHAAHVLSQRVFTVMDKLVSGQMEGPQQTLKTGEVVHSWPVPPLRIYYQRRDEVLWIVRIYHQAREPL
jgi:plasmid stabilization system protein ParE